MPPKFNLRASIFQNFPGGHVPRPPSISMLHMLIVLRIITQSHDNQWLAITSSVGCITLKMVAPGLSRAARLHPREFEPQTTPLICETDPSEI